MTSQDTKHLTISQIKRLIKNHGLTEKLSNGESGREYCLEALNAALVEKLSKQAAKVNYKKLMQDAALNAQNTEAIVAPPSYTRVYAQANEKQIMQSFTDTSSMLAIDTSSMPKHNYAQIMQDTNKPKYKAQFNFSAPLWQLEQVCSFRRLPCNNYTPKKIFKFNIAS